MNEFDIIREFFAGGTSPDLVVGVGDDAAVFNVSPGHQVTTSVDTLVEGVHFLPSMNPADLGFHVAAVNISDMAAMCARPRWALLSISRRDVERHWLREFSDGLGEALRQDGIVLIGGDMTQGSQCTLSLQIIGEIPVGTAVLRSGANVGDGIYVTGNPGDAAAGLEACRRDDSCEALYRKFARPQSRVPYAQSLRSTASAAIDISDGLYADMSKLLSASRKGAELHIDRLPLSDDLLTFVSRDEAVNFCLGGGDDYELLFTSPGAPPQSANMAVTCIGHVTEGRDILCFDDGERFEYTDKGYLHFQ